MHTEPSESGDLTVGTLYKDSDNLEEKEEFRAKKVVSEDLMLIVGSSGSGKSVLTNGLLSELQRHGFTCVVATEKFGDEFAYGFVQFPPTSSWHLRRLLKDGRRAQPTLAKIYHPMTLKMPTGKPMPPVNFFSFSIKDMTEEAFLSILAGDAETQTIRLCATEVKGLRNDEGVYEFLWKVRESIRQKSKGAGALLDASDETMFVDVGVPGDLRTISHIVSSMKFIREHPLIQPAKSETNIDFIEMLNDQKRIHILSTKWLGNDRRLRYFSYILWLQQLVKAIESGRIKHKVAIVFEEVKVLIPYSSDTSFEKLLTKQIVDILSTVRSKGKGVFVICTTQNYDSTNKKLRESCNNRVFLKLSPEDIQFLQEKQNYPKDSIEFLRSFRIGEACLAEDLENPDKGAVKGEVCVAPWAHKDAGADYIEEYARYFPGQMEKYDGIYDVLFARCKQDMEMAELRFKKFKADYIEELRKKQEAKQRKKEEKEAEDDEEENELEDEMGEKETQEPKKEQLDEIEKFVNEPIEETKPKHDKRAKFSEEMLREIYAMKMRSPDIPWSKLGRALGITPPTAKSWFLKACLLMDDEENHEKWKGA